MLLKWNSQGHRPGMIEKHMEQNSAEGDDKVEDDLERNEVRSDELLLVGN